MKKALTAVLATLAVAAVFVPWTPADPAGADTASFTVTPTSAYANTGQAATWKATLPTGSTDTVELSVLSGPDATSQPSACTGTAPNFSCTLTPSHGSGVDVVCVFMASDSTATCENSDGFQKATLVVSGTPAVLAVVPTGSSGTQPVTKTASAQTCAPFTLTLQDASGRPVVNTPVTVTLSQANAGGNGPIFCDPTSTTFPAVTPTGLAVSTTSNGVQASFATGPDNGAVAGQVSLGVSGTVPSTGGGAPVDIAASASSLSASARLSVQPGGAGAVTNVSVTPTSQTMPAANSRQSVIDFLVTLTDAAGDPVAGVYPTFSVGGTDSIAAKDCPASGTDGTALCTYTVPAASTPMASNGSDTISVWVSPDHQDPKSPESSPCSGDGCTDVKATPSPTVSVLAPAFSPMAVSTTVGCGALVASTGTAAVTCPVPAGRTRTVVTLAVYSCSTPQCSATSLDTHPYVLRPVLTGSNTDGFSVQPPVCTTSNGVCSVAVTAAKPVDGQQVTVTADFVPGNPADNPAPRPAVVKWTATPPTVDTMAGQPPAQTVAEPAAPASGDPMPADAVATHDVSLADPTGRPDAGATVADVVLGGNAGQSRTCGTADSNGVAQCTDTDGYGKTGQLARVPRTDTLYLSHAATDTSGAVTHVANATVHNYWVTSDGVVDQVGLDLAGCNGTFSGTTAPYSTQGFDGAATAPITADPSASSPTVPVTRLCLAVTDQGGSPLLGTPLMVTTGPGGVLTDAAGAPLTDSSGNPVTSETVYVSDVTSPDGAHQAGYATAFVRGTATGSQGLVACTVTDPSQTSCLSGGTTPTCDNAPTAANANPGTAATDPILVKGCVTYTADPTTSTLAIGPGPTTGVHGTATVCPPGQVPPDGFTDVGGSVHADDIACIAYLKITKGTTATTYSPDAAVTRAQMASFVVRALTAAGVSLPAAGATFPDVPSSNVHAADIGALAAAKLVLGYADGSYGPDDPVTRAQMASFLARASVYRFGAPLPAGSTQFSDVTGDAHLKDINSVAAVGLTAGYPDGSYRPGAKSTRAQMASFVARLADLLVAPSSAPEGYRAPVVVMVTPQTPLQTPPSGAVQVLEGSTVLVSGTLDSDPKLLTLPVLSVGTHQLQVSYAGDSRYAASTSKAFTWTVTKATSSTRLSLGGTPTAGQELKLTATTTPVSDPSAAVSGTVTFTDNGKAIGDPVPTTGTASTTVTPSAGKHVYAATYSGNDTVAGSTSSVTVTVPSS